MKLFAHRRVAMLSAAYLAANVVFGSEFAPPTAAELGKACADYTLVPKGNGAAICTAFLRGFIAGSHNTVVLEPAEGIESYFERAYRTRYGNRTGQRPLYCIRHTATLDDVTRELLLVAGDHTQLEKLSATELIEATLLRFHRCLR